VKNFYFAYRSFWPEHEAHRRFNEIGVKTICFFPANTVNSLGEPYCKYPPNWVFKDYSVDGQYDFEPVDAQINDLMKDSPGANFICMVDLNTPVWLSAHILKCDSFNQLGRICSDSEWRRATANYLQNFLSHMEQRYPDKIVAYVLSGGSTSEWYDLSNLAESPSRLAAWNRERREKGLPPAEIPGLMAREHVSFDNLLRDPAADGEALRYIRFCQSQIVDTIKFFLGKAREVIPRKTELGVFFGYPLCLQGWRVIAGNNDCGELLKSPELDFIISPIAGKTFAASGKGGGDLGPTESVELAGKRYLRECDQKTHTYNKKLSKYITINFDVWESEAETLAGIKRELGYSLIKRTSLWWFDMWGGFYNPPVVMELLKKCHQIYWMYIEKQVEKIAEIALIVDPDSIYYLNQNDNERTVWFYQKMKGTLDLTGSPYETYNLEDIPRIQNQERIKLWLLPGIFEITRAKREILDRFVGKERNT